MKRLTISLFGILLALGTVQANAASILVDGFDDFFAGPVGDDGTDTFPTELYGFPGPDPLGLSTERGASALSTVAGIETIATVAVGTSGTCTSGCLTFGTSNDATGAVFSMFQFLGGVDLTQGAGGDAGSLRFLFGEINGPVSVILELDDLIIGPTSSLAMALDASDSFTEVAVNLDAFDNTPGNDFTSADFFSMTVLYDEVTGGAPVTGLNVELDSITSDVTDEVVPTPAVLGLMLVALGGIAARRRRLR